MPNIKSAIKRVKTTKTRSAQNAMVKTAYKTAVKNYKVKATELFKVATKAVEKAANKGVIKDNTASRKKSSLARALNTL